MYSTYVHSNGTRECQSLNGYVKLGIEGRQRQLQSGIGFDTSGGNRIHRPFSGKEGRKSRNKGGQAVYDLRWSRCFPRDQAGLARFGYPGSFV